MQLLEKIYNSRNTLKQLLDPEWNVDSIEDVSLKELEAMYVNENSKTYVDSGCNITLTHKKLPSHKLHIIYYNFPQLHLSGTKINKSVCDKLIALYKQEGFESDETLFDKEDSLLVIINEPVSDNITDNIETTYKAGLSELKSGINPELTKEMKTSNFEVGIQYFRNIHIFHIDTLIHNLLQHTLVPQHIPIRHKQEIQKILSETNAELYQLPVILRTDPIAKLVRLCPGDICKIIRTSEKCGESVYYRVCK
tara:strand:- start:737 stop:1492 length:756 start_codon:yes stop_codon:yes gene_type:complete